MSAFLDRLGYAFTPVAWLGHLLLAVPILLAVGVVLRLCRVRGPWFLAAAVNAGFWWGREKVEFEWTLRTEAGLRTIGPFWWRAWMPWDWGAASAAEFLAPTLFGLLLATLLERRLG